MFRGNRDVLRASRGRDGVYAPSVSYLFFALIAMPWFRLTGRRVIYHFHDLGPHPRWLLRVAAFFITDVLHNTEEGRRQMLAAAAGGMLALLGARSATAQTDLSPDAALAQLMDGNARFVSGGLTSFDEDLAILKQKTVAKQEPFDVDPSRFRLDRPAIGCV